MSADYIECILLPDIIDTGYTIHYPRRQGFQFMWTDTQTTIIHRPSGNTVVYASPGSGKTTVLTQHIVHQLREQPVSPDNIMMITFTRQAAKELVHRIAALCTLSHKALSALRIGTFHAEMFRMLLQAKVPVKPILGQGEQTKLIRQALRESGLTSAVHVRRMQQFLTASRAQIPARSLPRVYAAADRNYRAMKRNLDKWDFDDIFEVFYQDINRVLNHVPAITYLLVDEFQDTNAVQWAFVTSVLHKWGGRLFIVGDDDQSIYAFRGASPRWLMEAHQILPDTKAFQLATNFRSDKDIVTAAGSVISHNMVRVDKPFSAFSGEHGCCLASLLRDEAAEGHVVARLVARVLKNSPSVHVAVLARTRRQLYRAWAECHEWGMDANIEWTTFHGSKGKEYDGVFIVGAVEHNPYLMEPSDDLEEERRLFYVAMTRARHGLCITAPSRINGRKFSPSQYLSESNILCLPAEELISHYGLTNVL